MTKSLKFRFYHKDYGMSENFSLRECLYPLDSRGIPQRIGNKIMQYIGMKDKNEKEIYEGDIIKGKRGYKEVVMVLKESGYLGYDLHWQEETVIGNIYENPELLEDTD